MVAFAVAAFLAVVTAPWYQENAPGTIRMVGSLIFPSGLVMIVYVVLSPYLRVVANTLLRNQWTKVCMTVMRPWRRATVVN